MILEGPFVRLFDGFAAELRQRYPSGREPLDD